MRHAVLSAVGTIPPGITHFDSIVRTFVLCFFDSFIPRQTCQRTIVTESAEAIKAHFVAVVITRVMTEIVVVLRDTKRRALLAVPAMHARLTSVLRTNVMPAIIVARNALRAAVATKPRRQALFQSVRTSTSVTKNMLQYELLSVDCLCSSPNYCLKVFECIWGVTMFMLERRGARAEH